ncbi:UDP-glycosyltransferase 13 [Selaginella moellendorffii]|nr:UDP-glycosyltransferase 13 [Selaginella moellendorffii]|eukprot:XP_002993002.2 UDP-glycosyltransferase 13 [Selaginella moellendorffii]
MEEEVPRLMVVPYSAQGHMIPALVLASRLAGLGFEVSYVCHDFRLEQVKREAKARACNPHIKFQTLKKNFPSKEQQESSSGHDSMELMGWAFGFHPEDGVELKELISAANPPISCIITDNLLASWAQDVADELNIPRIIFYPSPGMALAFHFYVKNMLHQNKLPVRVQELVRIPGIDSAGLSPLSSDQVIDLILETVPKVMRDFYVTNAVRAHEAAGVMCNTFAAIEEEACIAVSENPQINPNKVPFVDIGPLLPDSYFAEDNACEDYDKVECLAWLDEQPTASVVYISFGSFARANRKQIEELALGLEASEKRFLWVLNNGAEELLPEGFLERATTNKTGMAVRKWAPQLLVLSHRAVGGFMTHCGWNSTMESLSRGVPMITMPFYGEQRGNARIIVEHLGIGVGLAKDGKDGLITRIAFEQAFRAVIDESECLRRKGAQVKEAARAAFNVSPRKIKDLINKVLESNRSRQTKFF